MVGAPNRLTREISGFPLKRTGILETGTAATIKLFTYIVGHGFQSLH